MYLWDEAIAAEVTYRRDRLAGDEPTARGAIGRWWHARSERRRRVEAAWTGSGRRVAGSGRPAAPAVGPAAPSERSELIAVLGVRAEREPELAERSPRHRHAA